MSDRIAMMVRQPALTTALAAFVACASAQAQQQPPDPAAGTETPQAQSPQGEAAPPVADPSGGGQDPAEQKPTTVVVTARKWEEALQDVPQSVTPISDRKIREAGINNVRDASLYSPNTLMTEFTSPRLSFPFIRGVGSGQGEPAVQTSYDGVPQLAASSTNLPMLDVERIEFMRGPLGALYGRNTLGGAINVTTKAPSNEAEVDAFARFGNFNIQDYRLSFSAPLVADKLFLSASGMYSKRDGYTINDFTGNDVDYRETGYARVQLLWAPDDRNEVRLNIYGERYRDGGFVLFDLPSLEQRPNRINHDFEGKQNRDLLAGSLSWNRYSDDVDFTSITGVQDWTIEEAADFDFTALDALRRFTDEEQTYFFQEFRFASPEEDGIELSSDSRLRWLAGVSGFYADTKESAANEFRPGGGGIVFPPTMIGTDRANGDFDSWAFGVFGQLTLELAERWDFTAALRYDYETKDANINRVFETPGPVVPVASTQERASFDQLSPRFSISYRWSESVMTYVLAAKGFKAGGFNLTAPTGQAAFGPETNWTYEAGIKTNWLEETMTANLAAFYIDWDDMQLSQFDIMSGGYVTNAGESTSAGVELEVAYEPVDGLELFGAAGYLNTEFKQYVDQFGQDVSGNALPFAPRSTGNLGAQYTLAVADDVSLFARGEYFHIGRFYYDPGNLASERYSLTNFRLGAGGTHWRLEGWVRNALDERYSPVAFQPNPGDPTQFVGESAAQRTYGVTLRATF